MNTVAVHGAGTGGVTLPGMCGDQGGQGVDADRAGIGGYPPVGCDRQHVTQMRSPSSHISSDQANCSPDNGTHARVTVWI
jgi:hypothetical protein